ncbi:melanoma-associated antigen C1-like [Palaemon carinicauda]|uniref:melanoma-associated antigen C1-like n=1 Tax=Palaemon carinicauda TaxID=392227 RepID=UPI0035B5C8F8
MSLFVAVRPESKDYFREMAQTGSGRGGGGGCSSSFGQGGSVNLVSGDCFVSTPDQNHPSYFHAATDTHFHNSPHQVIPRVQGVEELAYPASEGHKGVSPTWHPSQLLESEDYQTLLQSTSSLTISPQPSNQWNVTHPSSIIGKKPTMIPPESVYHSSSSGIHSYQPEDSGYNSQGSMYFQSDNYGVSSSKPIQKMQRECGGLLPAAPGPQAPVMNIQPQYNHYPQQIQGHHYPQSMAHSFPTGVTPHMQQMNINPAQPSTSYYHPTTQYHGPSQGDSRYPLHPTSSQYMGYHDPKNNNFRGYQIKSPEAPPETIYNFPSDSTDEDDDDDDDNDVVLLGAVGGSDTSQRNDTSPESSNQKNQEELQRYQMIRHQNNLASCRYRRRKSENINENKQKLVTLQSENARLKAKVAGLQQLRDEMEKFWQNFCSTHVNK